MSFLLFLLGVALAEVPQTCPDTSLSPAVFTQATGAPAQVRLLPPTTCERGEVKFPCTPVEIRAKTLACISEPKRIEKSLIGYACKIGEGEGESEIDPHLSRFSWNKEEKTLEAKNLDLADWHALSNPAFCGARIAYWALVKVPDQEAFDVSIVVYDLDLKRELIRKKIDKATLNANDRKSLQQPKWASDAKSVEFVGAQEGTEIKSVKIEMGD